MNVGELQDLLARLPEDMPVHVSTDGSIGAFHVGCVDKRPRTRAEKITFIEGEPCPEQWRGQMSVIVPGDGSCVLPGSVVLRGGRWHGGAQWFAPEPPFELRGRWPRARTLAETIRKETRRG